MSRTTAISMSSLAAIVAALLLVLVVVPARAQSASPTPSTGEPGSSAPSVEPIEGPTSATAMPAPEPTDVARPDAATPAAEPTDTPSDHAPSEEPVESPSPVEPGPPVPSSAGDVPMVVESPSAPSDAPSVVESPSADDPAAPSELPAPDADAEAAAAAAEQAPALVPTASSTAAARPDGLVDVAYVVEVTNPDDRPREFEFRLRLAYGRSDFPADTVRIVEGPTVTGAPTNPDWDGEDTLTLTDGSQPIEAGATAVWMIDVVVDVGSLVAEELPESLNCTRVPGEGGSGVRAEGLLLRFDPDQEFEEISVTTCPDLPIDVEGLPDEGAPVTGAPDEGAPVTGGHDASADVDSTTDAGPQTVSASSTGETLPETGMDTPWLAVWSMLLVALGTTLVRRFGRIR